jgi:hypothetical protein
MAMENGEITTPEEFIEAIAIIAEMAPSLADDPALRDDLAELQPYIESYREWKRRRFSQQEALEEDDKMAEGFEKLVADIKLRRQRYDEWREKDYKRRWTRREIIVEGTLEQFEVFVKHLMSRSWSDPHAPVMLGGPHRLEGLPWVEWSFYKRGDDEGGAIMALELPHMRMRIVIQRFGFPDPDLFEQTADELEEEMKRWGFKAVQPTFSEDEATTKRGPTIKIQERAKVCKELKDAHPEWTQEKLAMVAGDRLGEILSAESVRNVYRTMGWKWKRGERTR